MMATLSSTMTPFLYQTRTLAVHWARSATRPRMVNNAPRRTYTERHTPLITEESVAWTPSHDPQGVTNDGNDGQKKLVIRRTTTMHGPEAPLPAGLDLAPSDESNN